MLCCLCIGGSGCIDAFFLDVEADDKLLVIDGFFSNAATKQYLNLSYTRDYGTTTNEGIADAIIAIIDQQNNTAFYTSDGKGGYVLDSKEFIGKEGNSYYLDIQLANGKTYQTHPQILPKRIKPTRLDLKIEKEIDDTPFSSGLENAFIKLYIDTPVKTGKEAAYLRWRIEEVYSFQDQVCHPLDFAINCYVYLKPKEEIVILSGQDLSDEVIKGIPVYTKKLVQKSPEYEQKHVFTIYQHSITKSAFNFLDKAKGLSEATGSIFDRPPAALRGNGFNVADDEELVLGFFEVTAIDTIRVFTRPLTFEGQYPFITYCSNFWPNRYTPDCCDCLLIEGSTLTAPDYW